MTTRVLSVVITPNVHRACVSTHSKQSDGSWLKDDGAAIVEIGVTYVHDSYITDTRRIVIEEIPLKEE